MIGIKKTEFQMDLKNRFEILQELDEMNTLNGHLTNVQHA